MTNEELTKIIAAIPVYEDEHYSLREYQDAKVTVMTMIENYNKLKTENTKLKEAIKDIKANMESYCDMNCPYSEKQREFMCKACMMGDAIDMVDNYTEGLI